MKSKVYFKFTKWRLLELQNVHLQLAHYRPSNYGVSTSVQMHLMCHTCHSPEVKKDYLMDALRELRFEEIMMDYGMFFIHNLDLENHYIRCIVKVDPETCREHMGRGGKVP